MTISAERQRLTGKRLRLFKELGAALARGAALAIAERTRTSLEYVETQSSLLRVETLMEATGDPENAAVAVYSRVNGEAPGHAAYLFPYRKAAGLVDVIEGREIGSTARIETSSSPVLRDLGSQLICSSVVALSKHAGIQLKPDPPVMAVDMAWAIVSSVVAFAGETADLALVVTNRFGSDSDAVDGLFLYIFDPESMEAIESAMESRAGSACETTQLAA